MKLAIFNGSPRKTNSNSTILINHFSNGYHGHNHHNTELHYLADVKKNANHIEAFKKADTAIIIFPLYTDAMPGQVKYFFEQIVATPSKGKRVGFIVQSGFPEAYHSTFVERYLKKLSQKMEWDYLGTVIKGGIEGIQIMPPNMTRKVFGRFELLGKHFAASGKFEPELVKKLRKPYRISKVRLLFFRLFLLTGLNNYYWNVKLKENNAFEKRFDAPFAPA
ncbi:MAG: NAD(P)H-dependent oxidoreductase [Prolixibacteraceae bacterium]|nr:NAD(P)H-dependent oxidoreductase [Prolixibacteraceae bacterium]